MRIVAVALAIGLGICGSAAADTVELKSGDKLEGVVLDSTDEYVEMEHPVLGRIRIPTDEIVPEDEEDVPPGVFGTSFLEGWHKALSAGFKGSSGKSRDMSANVDFNLKREIERHRSNLVARYYFAEADEKKSDNQFITNYTHDFLFPDSDFFPFVKGEYIWDRFQDWRHRAGGDAGVGYQILKNDTFDLLGRLGAGVAATWRGGPADRTEYPGLVALETEWTMMEGMSLSWDTSYQPDFGDLPTFRLESRAEWKIAIGIIEGLGFKVGGSYVYDEHEKKVRQRHDRKWYGNLVYDF